MKILVVFAHPGSGSYGHAVLDAVSNESKSKGHEVVVRDLYAMNYQPVLNVGDFAAMKTKTPLADTKIEQDHVRWADRILFIHPLWWTGLPAILKGWVDRTMLYGFAYQYGANGVEGLLKGKKALVITTTGTPEAVYRSTGMFDALEKTIDTGVFRFCGVEMTGHIFLAGVTSIDDTARKAMLEDVKKAIDGL